ncbi:MAG: tol-pal system-associated acyl-CoA thioesterase [Alphaproteobacteria bacterium]|nr:tol-pal system-associated acyl-CoA thioesterase [Alphaproteobacteria bacterium]
MSQKMKAHRYPVRVYYEDTDAGGIVYHANYLRFAERGRTEALRDLGVPHAEMSALHGLFFMVRRIKVDYLAPARLDDSLVVETKTLAVGGATVELRQDVVRAGDEVLLARIELQLVCGRISDQRPARIPPRWREAMLRLQPEQE